MASSRMANRTEMTAVEAGVALIDVKLMEPSQLNA